MANGADEAGFQSEYTQSITSSVTDYVMENGRRYHRYSEGKYVLPNDDV